MKNEQLTEEEKIKQRYETRKSKGVQGGAYVWRMVNEREKKYAEILRSHFSNLSSVRLLEIGAGSGQNLGFFKESGILPGNIFATELLDDRVEELKINHPDITVYPGNSLNVPEDKKFDIIFQSTVFTSILDTSLKKQLAQKMLRLLAPGGIIIWYDFIYNNPRNPDVKGIGVGEIKQLFEGATIIQKQKTTLLPPLARRVGKAYNFFVSFGFLRSHVIVVIKHKQALTGS